jgi:hypothetical protein
MRTLIAAVLATAALAPMPARAQRAGEGSAPLRIALAKQPFSPTGTSPGPTAMASGGIQQALAQLGAAIRVDEAALTPDEATEYGAWKRLGMALGHNKVPDGPSSEQLARLFEAIFRRYPKAVAIGFATLPATDEGGLSIAALNRMIAGAVRGVKARQARR